MAKRKKATAGPPTKSNSGPTRPSTFRLSPAGIADVRRLSAALDLRSQAGAIELAAHQVLATFARLDAKPPMSAEQLNLTVTAIRAAGVSPRTLGATANYVAMLFAAVAAAEHTLVPGECSAKEYCELAERVKGLDPVAALWAVGRAFRD